MSIVVQREDLTSLEQEWRDLLPSCANSRVFLSPLWLRSWWQTFGAGRELMLLSARDEGRLIGVAPMMRERGTLTFAGNTKVCDYMDFTCAAGREAEMMGALFRALSEEPWDDLRLWAMREDSPSLTALAAVSAEFGYSCAVDVEDVCPQVDLPTDWESHLASLDRKHRHELKRKLRKLLQAGTVELEILASPLDVTVGMETFFWMLRESRADKAAFMTTEMESFFRNLVPSLAGGGLAELVFLRLAGIRTAAVVCLHADGETLLYNSGYDPAYSALSVGLLSKVLALQRAIEQGKTRFDFLRGHERYKYELGARDIAVHRVTIRRAP